MLYMLNQRSFTFINNTRVEYPPQSLVLESIDASNPSSLFSEMNPLIYQNATSLLRTQEIATYFNRMAAIAAHKGKLNFLCYLLRRHIISYQEFPASIIIAAAEGGRLKCLKYFEECGFLSPLIISFEGTESYTTIMNMAFRSGSLGCIKFLVEQGLLLEINNNIVRQAVYDAASQCNYKLLQYYNDIGIQITEEHLHAVSTSATHDVSSIKRFNCFMYIHKHIGVPIIPTSIVWTLLERNDRLRIAKYIINHVIDYTIPGWKQLYRINTDIDPYLQPLLEQKYRELQEIHEKLPTLLESQIASVLTKYIINPYLQFYTE